MEHPRSSDPRRYLDPKVLSKIARLEVKARLVVEGFISGLHRSPYHGFSIEFAEHREYVPGDDIRHIDWKVFGRSDRFYIKQYEEETNLKAHILVDASESMAYPYPERGGRSAETADRISKYEYACYIAASLAHLIIRQQDAVGLAVFDNQVRHFVSPSASPAQMSTLVDALESADLKEKTRVGSICTELANRITRKGMVILISDLLDETGAVTQGLRHLRYKGHEVIVFHLLDHEELTFPFQRMTLFEGLEDLPDLLEDPRAIREGYLEELNLYLDEVRSACRDHLIDYVQLDTNEKLHVALTTYLAHRAGSQRTK